MSGSEQPRPPLAVLETSFWTVAYKGELVATILDYFTLIVPAAVGAEISARSTRYPAREYPDQTLFRQLRARIQEEPPDMPPPLNVFGPGEAAAIALAQHVDQRGVPVTLLVNEGRATAYARNLRLSVLTVPSFIVALCSRGTISDCAARIRLRRIAPNTPADYIQQAELVLDTLRASRHGEGENG